MRILAIMAFAGIICMAEKSNANEVPQGILKIMDSLRTDSTMHDGLNFAKKWLQIDKNIQLSDINVGTPIEIYRFKKWVYDSCPVDMSIQDLIEPINLWRIPMFAHGKCVYYVEAAIKDGNFNAGGTGEGDDGFWNKLRDKYPENTGVNPILIESNNDKFLFFPQAQGQRKLFYVDPNFKRPDSLSLVASNSLDTLDDSREILRLLKKKWVKYMQIKKAYEKKSAALAGENEEGAK